jgi:hypothetical protein
MAAEGAQDFPGRRGGKLAGRFEIPYRCPESRAYFRRERTLFSSAKFPARKRKQLLLADAKRFRDSRCSCEWCELIRYELSDRLLGPPPKDAPPRPKLAQETIPLAIWEYRVGGG